MTLKWTKASVVAVLTLLGCSHAGVIPQSHSDHEDHHEHHHEDHHEHHHEDHHQHHHEGSVASSFMHFHGPVEGPEFEIKVPYIEPHHHLKHGEENHLIHGHDHGYVNDYVAHPKYEFSYGVEDYHTGDFHSQKETRDGSSVSGEYSISEPGGGIRVVSYRADKDGFHAVVHTTGKNDHSGGTYGYAGHESHHQHEQQDGQETQLLQEYPATFSAHEEGHESYR